MKKIGIFISVIMLIGAGAALDFDVQVSAITSFNTFDTRYSNQTSSLQNLNLSVENTGSIGCTYRLKGVFNYRKNSRERFSEPYSLWPGEETRAELFFIPENYTGKVRAEIYSTYCGQEEKIKEIEFNSTRKNIPNATVNSTTVTADDERAELSLQVENGVMVPQQTPPYWKASGSKIVNGSATLRYDPPIFQEEEKLNYTVVDDSGDVLGTTSVALKSEVEPGLIEKVWNQRLKLLFAVLLISLAVNVRLARHLRDRSDS